MDAVVCKTCGKEGKKVICDNCIQHLAQLSADELRAAGCKVTDKLDFPNNKFCIVDRYCAIPVSVNHINMTIVLNDLETEGDKNGKKKNL